MSMPSTHESLFVAPSNSCGYGLYTACDLKKGERLGEYTGQTRRYDLWCKEIEAKKQLLGQGTSPFIKEELYAAWAGVGDGKGVVIDAYAKGNAMSASPVMAFLD